MYTDISNVFKINISDIFFRTTLEFISLRNVKLNVQE